MRYYFITLNIHGWWREEVGGLMSSRDKDFFDIKLLNARRIT